MKKGNSMITRRTAFSLGATLLPLAGARAELPEGTIRFIVPFPPGGPGDVAARVLSPKLSERLSRTIVVENRSGAGGVAGIDAVAKSAPDGRTLGFATVGGLAIAPSLMTMPFDPMRDLAYVSRIAAIPELLVVNPRLPVRNLTEFLHHARQNSGKIDIASSGNGSIPHMAIEMLKMKAGIKVVHVPYRGVAPALADLIGGQVQAMIADISAFIAPVKHGSLRAIALAAAERSPQLPDVPTTAEAGLADYDVSNWYGLIMPGTTPAAVVAQVNAAMVATLHEPAIIHALSELGATAGASTPEAFRAFTQAETARWSSIARASGARMD
jgi:tripartite-type tricarboxylate transporter receptor subunit TctC